MGYEKKSSQNLFQWLIGTWFVFSPLPGVIKLWGPEVRSQKQVGMIATQGTSL